MILGLGLYLWGKPRYLGAIGNTTNAVRAEAGALTGGGRRLGTTQWAWICFITACVLSVLFGVAYAGGLTRRIGEGMDWLAARPAIAWGVISVLLVGVLGWVVWFLSINRREDRGPIITIFIYMIFNAFFWIAFEQAGTSINLFTDRNTDRMIGTFQVPTTWFQSVNPLFIIILAPVFAAIWTWLGRRGLNPSQPVKIALGLIFVSLGYVIITLGAARIGAQGGGTASAAAQASMLIVIGTYFMHTVGELCLSPTGLSYVTKAAPVRFVSLLMGVYFVSSFMANLGAGLVAGEVEKIESGTTALPWTLVGDTGSQADFFLLFVLVPGAAGLLILLFSPLLKRLQRNSED
jgi:POT family proton-dependent oligopeptide transporter